MSLAWLNPAETRAVIAYFGERFGVPPEAFEGLRLFRRSGYVCAVRGEAAEAAEALHLAGGGLRIAKEMGPGRFKPATRGVQLLASGAGCGAVDLRDEQLRALLQGQTIPVDRPGRGFVLLRWEGAVIGVGLLRGGELVGQLPRTITEHLRLRPGEPLV